MEMYSVDSLSGSLHQLETFLSEWTKYIEDFSLVNNSSSANQLCLKEENDHLKDKLACLQRSIDFQKEQYASLLDYNAKLEQLVEQKEATCSDPSCKRVSTETLDNAFSMLLGRQKELIKLWREDIQVLRSNFAASLQKIHIYLFHQLGILVETFQDQQAQWMKCSRENRQLRRYIQEWKGNLRVVARVSI